MNWFLLASRCALALVFLVAGIAKLADRRGTKEALREFSVPEPLADPLTHLLPLAEIAVAVALLPLATARVGAVGALSLLGTFTAAIAFALARGRAPDCHCFGQIHSSRAGWKSLVRNGLLLSVALSVVAEGWTSPGASAVTWLEKLTTAEIVGLIGGLAVASLVALLVFILVQLLHQNGRLLLRFDNLEMSLGRLGNGLQTTGPQGQQNEIVDQDAYEWERFPQGLALGTTAPPLEVQTLGGDIHNLPSLLLGGRTTLLVFTDPNCGPCEALAPEIAQWQREHQEHVTIAIISRGDVEVNRRKASAHALSNVVLQRNWDVSTAYGAHGTPSAVAISPNGLISSPVALGVEAIRQLLNRQLEGSDPKRIPVQASAPMSRAPQGLPVGTFLPKLALTDLDGRSYDLADLVGRSWLAVFWDPACGFCQQMIPEIKDWEREPDSVSLPFVLISKADTQILREHNLSSLVLVDADARAMIEFGAYGTPIGVLIDEEGRIGSVLAIGAAAIFELARTRTNAQDQPISV